MDVEIQKGVPMPRGVETKFPWNDMEVGDSFAYPGSNNAAHTVARQASARNGKTFKARQTDEGMRIWRVA